MEQYISKPSLVAEIERRIVLLENNSDGIISMLASGIFVNEYKDLLSFLDTLETKEVDLEKELENLIEKEKAFVTDDREVKYYNGDSFNHIYELEFIAKYFFELGLKTKKGE